LMNSQYARKKDDKYFLWQYFDSCYPTISMCAFDGPRLIGMFGLQERTLEGDIHAGQAIDSIVSSDWRRKGVITLLGKEAFHSFKNMDMLFSLPNQHWKAVCEKAFGWKSIGKIDSVILRGHALKNVSRKAGVTNPATYRRNSPRARFAYNAETRTWRFDQRPEYTYFYVRLTDEVFAITKIFTDPLTGVSYGDIVDFKCDLDNYRLLEQLFVKSCEYLLNTGVENITTWALPRTTLHDVTASLGFVDMPQERYFCVRVINPEYEYLYDLSNWHLVQADVEIY
jgi:hypothetical protein